MISQIGNIAHSSLLDTVRQISQTRQTVETAAASKTQAAEKSGSFGDMLSDLVKQVDTKSKESQAAAEAVMTGRSNNIHQAMLSMQESGVAFTLMTEVRNKLVSAYQELMRMQV
jgi:flagellar hook-basal body complex protein FliE